MSPKIVMLLAALAASLCVYAYAEAGGFDDSYDAPGFSVTFSGSVYYYATGSPSIMDMFSTPMLTGVVITTSVTTVSVNGMAERIITGGMEVITKEDTEGVDKG